MRSDVAGVLGLDFDSNNPGNGDGPRLLGWANDAVVDMLRRTHCYVSSATLALTAGQDDYDLDPNILAIEDLYLTSQSGGQFVVHRRETTEIVNLRLFQATTSPMQLYAVAGTNLLMVYPTPVQNDVLTIYYVPRPIAMANSNDDPSVASLGGIPPEFHYGLELYMMWKAADAFDDESSSSGETYRRLYLGDPTAPPGTEQRFGFIGTMSKDIRRKGGKHLGPAPIPPRSRKIYIPTPGVDVGSQYAT